MRKSCMLVIALFTFLMLGPLAAPFAANDKPAGKGEEKKLAPLDRMLGEWEINARWTSGEELHARNVIDWGISKKFITAKTFVKNPDGTEYQRYDAVFGSHPKK